jgi:hypothetical protein
MLTGLIGLIVFCADIYAILTIIKSRVTPGTKVLWCLLVIILPVLGLIIWYAAGPKA